MTKAASGTVSRCTSTNGGSATNDVRAEPRPLGPSPQQEPNTAAGDIGANRAGSFKEASITQALADIDQLKRVVTHEPEETNKF